MKYVFHLPNDLAGFRPSSKQLSAFPCLFYVKSFVLLFNSVPQFAPYSGHSRTWLYRPPCSALKAYWILVGIRCILVQFMGLEIHKHFLNLLSLCYLCDRSQKTGVLFVHSDICFLQCAHVQGQKVGGHRKKN